MYQMDLDIVWMEPIGYVHQKEEVYPYDIRRNSEPLSAAIWCGAIRCVERLLPVRAEDISRFARKALSWGPLPGDEARRQAVEEIVCRKYGIELAELLTPGDFGNRNSPLLLLPACPGRPGEPVPPDAGEPQGGGNSGGGGPEDGPGLPEVARGVL